MTAARGWYNNIDSMAENMGAKVSSFGGELKTSLSTGNIDFR